MIACALADDDRSEFGNDDERYARYEKGNEYFSDGVIATCGSDDLEYEKKPDTESDGRGLPFGTELPGKTKPKDAERTP